MDLGLTGKRVLITGASRGIGFSIAQHFAQEGADIAFCARSQASVDKAAQGLAAQGHRVFAQPVDVRDEAAISAWIEQAASDLGGIDIIISNVSTRDDLNADNLWRETFEADFNQHVQFFESALPHLTQSDHASALFIASIASILTQLPPQELAYGTMKAALVNYVGQMAVRTAHKGVRVNAVSPGPIYIEDGFWGGVKKHAPEAFERASQLPAMGRLGTAEEVAKAVVFLASPAASYVTGANLRIDGAAVKAANF